MVIINFNFLTISIIIIFIIINFLNFILNYHYGYLILYYPKEKFIMYHHYTNFNVINLDHFNVK